MHINSFFHWKMTQDTFCESTVDLANYFDMDIAFAN